MIDPLVPGAMIAGLLGSGHCLGMCGSLVAALSLSGNMRGGFSFHLLYTIGRIGTYTAIGLTVGWLGSAIAFADAFAVIARSVLIGSDLFIILAGLGSAGLFRPFNLMALEGAAAVRPIVAAAGALRRLPSPVSALPLGLLFGLMPCGFLYAMAITAAQSAAPIRGAQIMLAFGLGTAPSIVLFGGAAQWLGNRARSWMLRGAGSTIALMGVINLLKHLRLMNFW